MLFSNLEVLFDEPKTQGFSENKIIKQDEKARGDILALQEVMEGMESALDAFPLTHHFAPHVYAREMFLPAGHTIIGKIHKHAHLNIVIKGKVKVSTEEGLKEINGPCVFTSYAGTKRAVHVIEDTIWITIHPTENTDLDEIEKEIIAPSYDALECDSTEKLEEPKT